MEPNLWGTEGRVKSTCGSFSFEKNVIANPLKLEAWAMFLM